MPLTLLTGPANSGKTTVIRDALAEAQDVRAALLVPSAADVEQARSALGFGDRDRVAVVAFDSHLADRWASAGDGRRLVSDVQRVALCRRAIHESAQATGRSTGFAFSLAEYVRRLAEHRKLPRRTRSDDTIVRLAVRYATLLDGMGLVERGEAFNALGELPEGPSDPEMLVAHLFTEFSHPQEAYLLARAAAGARVLVTLVWEAENPATAACNDLARRLGASADEWLKTAQPERAVGSAELASLVAGLYSGKRHVEPSGDLSLIVADRRDAEANRVVEQVSKWLAGGIPGQQVAIVYRHLEHHLTAISRALATADIRADYDADIPLELTAFGRAFTRLLAFGGRLERRDLAAFLRGPFAGAAPDAVDALESSWLARRTSGKEGLLADLGALGKVTQSIVLDAVELCACPLSEEVAGGWAALLQRMRLAASSEGESSCLTDQGEWDTAAEQAITQAIFEYVDVADETPSFQCLADTLPAVRVRTRARYRPGHVQVIPAVGSTSQRLSALVFAGLTADTPATRAAAYGERAVPAALSRAGVVMRECQDLDRERFRFYLQVSRARDRLALSRQANDPEGRTLAPSHLWEEVLASYRSSGPARAEVLPAVRVAPRAALTSLHGDRLSDREAAPIEWSGGALRRTGLSQTDLATIACRSTVSTSDIEAYIGCPFRWFYERAIGASRPCRGLGIAERGALVHEALRIVYEDLEANIGVRRLTKDTLEAGLDLAQAALERVRSRHPPAANIDERYALCRAEAQVRALLRRDAFAFSGFEPTYTEWSFGPGSSAAGIMMSGVEIRGRVDRIDTYADRLLVMDYKHGGTVPHERFEREGRIQLPVYAEAARRALGLSLAGAIYRDLSDGRSRGFVVRGAVPEPGGAATRCLVDDDAMEGIIHGALERAAGAIKGMQSGRIPARPLRQESCTHCSATGVCGSTK